MNIQKLSVIKILTVGLMASCMLIVNILTVSCIKKKQIQDSERKEFVLNDDMLKTTQWEEAKVQQLRSELELYGKISADNNKLIEIFPVVGGNVMKVFVELGDYVEKNQLLATIRSTQVASIEKNLNDAKNEVTIATRKLKVAEELYEGKLNTETDLLTAKGDLEKAQSELKRVQENYKIYSMKEGAIYEVRSPISGFIIQKNINEDMMLRDDHTNNIFDIAQIDEVWALANVSESDINQVKLGGMAQVVTVSYPDRVFRGAVDKIFNVIDTDSKSMKVRIKLKNPDFILKPDMKANIKIYYDEPQKKLCIPSSAVIFDRNNYYVLVYKSRSNIEVRKIEIIRQIEDATYIKHGLKEGENVITKNQLHIYDALTN